MTCQEVQLNLSLYLYGELDFQHEEKVEQHLSDCVLCQVASAREKSWHSSLNGAQLDISLELLSQCRQGIRTAISEAGSNPNGSWRLKKVSWRLKDILGFGALGFQPSIWSVRLAVASFLVFVGFSSSRLMDRYGVPGSGINIGLNEASLTGARIRDIQPSDNNRVRITLDQMEQRQITGGVDDERVRQLLLLAAKNSSDPGIRVDSVEILNGHGGVDVRDALLNAVQRDPNAAVRLKALDGLRQFADDSTTQNTLEFVLEHDESPEVRSQAIEVLAPANQRLQYRPDLARILQGITRSEQDDEYVRDRCFEILHEMQKPLDVY